MSNKWKASLITAAVLVLVMIILVGAAAPWEGWWKVPKVIAAFTATGVLLIAIALLWSAAYQALPIESFVEHKEELTYKETSLDSHIWYVSVGDKDYPRGWYFSDETEQFNGPYRTQIEAETQLELYCEQLDKPHPEGMLGECDEEPV